VRIDNRRRSTNIINVRGLEAGSRINGRNLPGTIYTGRGGGFGVTGPNRITKSTVRKIKKALEKVR
jgi:hypothetical protein